MRKLLLILMILTYSCDTGDLNVVMDLPIALTEVSGIEKTPKSDLIWMVNDSGNEPILYGLNLDGSIEKALKIDAKNRDWEDLTTDPDGNIYIGNFGNNDNDSKGLSVLKISKDLLNSDAKKIKPEIILFSYPEQEKFPPKKKNRHFDCEAFFYFNEALYLFTKSRSPKEEGKTNLYRLPTKKGHYKAELLDTFNTCDKSECWVTSADINTTGNKMALLTENSVFVFTNFKNTKFFDADYKRYKFKYNSQKESVLFKNDSTLYIADEYLGTKGGNLYEYKID